MKASSQPRVKRRSWLRRRLNQLEVDRAVFFAVATRCWQFIAGPVTVWFIAGYFTPEQQGFYYTFGSILAMQMFCELGLAGVLINLTSHEWAGLELDDQGYVIGDDTNRSRLASLIKFVRFWYGVSVPVFIVGIGATGMLLFSLRSPENSDWLLPWVCLVCLTGWGLWYTPVIAILEGCNQIVTVNQFRVARAVIGNLIVWSCITTGGGLWTIVASAGVQVIADIWLIHVRYRRLFGSLNDPGRQRMNWRTEIWPLQWRIAVTGVAGYFGDHLLIPVIFHFHGEEASGRVGMTLSVLTAIRAASIAWIQTRTPLFGMLAATRDYVTLDRIFWRLTMISFGVVFCACVALISGVAFLEWSKHPLSARLLDTKSTVMLCVGVGSAHLIVCMGIYIRAHKRDPYVVSGVSSSLLCGVLVWFYGSRFGVRDAVMATMVASLVYVLPVNAAIFYYCRKRWHEPERTTSEYNDKNVDN